MSVDQTSTMPADSWGKASSTMDALDAALGGDMSALQDVNIKIESDSVRSPKKHLSSLDDLISKNAEEQEGISTEPSQEGNQEPSKAEVKDVEILKVNGKEIEWDFSNRENLKAELQKGLSAQQKLKKAKEVLRENEALKKRVTDNESLSPLKKAQSLLEKGYTEHAIKSVLGDKNWESFLQKKIDEEIEYRSADPLQRAEIDSKRHESLRKYQENEQLERIKEAEERVLKREEAIIEQQFQGFLESASTKYDAGQWIEDSEMASALNESLSLAANNEIIQLQQIRERKRELGAHVDDVNARDIHQIYRKHALRIFKPYGKLQAQQATQRVETQSQQATQAAQAASQRNYSTSNIIADVMKRGGGMNDILDRLGSLK